MDVERLNRRWDRCWRKLAKLGLADEVGSAEYRRRRNAWIKAGRPREIGLWALPEAEFPNYKTEEGE